MFLSIIVQLLWCSYVFTVTYLLLLFFLIYLFVTAKAALPKIVLKKLPGLGSETSKSINKLIGTYGAYRTFNRILYQISTPFLTYKILQLHCMVPQYLFQDQSGESLLLNSVQPSDVYKITITMPSGMFEFVWVLFGLKNAAIILTNSPSNQRNIIISIMRMKSCEHNILILLFCQISTVGETHLPKLLCSSLWVIYGSNFSKSWFLLCLH